MALDLGTLTGYLELDSEKFDGVIEKLPDKIKGGGVAMGLAAAGVAALVGGSLAEGIATGMDLQDAQAHLTAALGLTGPESKRLGGIAGKLYSQAYGDSIDDVNDAVESVVSSIGGMKDANASAVQDMTAKVLNFNSAFGSDTERTTQIVGQLLKGGLVSDANEAMDLLTTAMQKVPKGVRDDILDAADEYGPFFKQLGYTGNDMFNTLVQGAAKGQFGIDKAGDAIKEFSIRATDLTDTNAQAALAKIGLSGKTMADDLLKGGSTAFGATQQIVQGLLNIPDSGQQAQAATALFGTQLEDLNKGQLTDFLSSINGTTDAMGKTAGSADKMGKAVNGTASNGVKELSRSWDMTIAKLTGTVVPVLTTVLGVINKHPEVLGIAATAIGVLALAFVAMSVSATIAAAAEAAVLWPILLVAAGLAALVAVIILVVTHWQQITDFLTTVVGAVWSWLQGVIQGFVTWWNGLWGTIGAAFEDGWNSLIAWFVSVPSRILAIVAGASAWLVTTGVNLLTGMRNGIVTGAVAVWSWFTGLQARVAGYLAGAAGWLVSKGSDLLGGMRNGIVTGWQGAASYLGGLGGRILGALGNFGGLLLSAGGDLMNGLLRGIRGGLGSILSAISGMAGDIMNRFKRILGIASPSKVFRSYGQFIGQGLVMGMSDLQGDIDTQVAGMVGAPNLNVGTSGGITTSSSGGAGATVDARVIVQGNVGWDEDEVARKTAERVGNTLSLVGIDGPEVVA